MIRKLRMKIIAVIMGALILVFALILIMLNVFMQSDSNRFTDEQLQAVIVQDGFAFSPGNGDGGIRAGGAKDVAAAPAPNHDFSRIGSIFYVRLDVDGNILEINAERMFDFSTDTAEEYALAVLDSGKTSGTIGEFRYLAAEKNYGTIIAFSQRSIEARLLSQLIQSSLWMALIACVVFFFFSLFLSKWVVGPVNASFEKQRRFIADASHELKTPLTIIGANTDVLEGEIGGNDKLYQIRSQINRMNSLIQALLSLARADEGATQMVMSRFDLSKAVRNTTLEFESHAFEEGKALSYDVQDALFYTGDEVQIRQLIAILIDNGIKHSNAHGQVQVALHQVGGHILLSVYNTGAGIPEGEREQIFDRFYRSDVSRSRETGGYGLGLSIARAIVSAHKGKITVESATGQWARFLVTL
ncbi:MAG: HAMP domain-containing histidine kinase [Oscillospiraceae bacterium]|nr:HAMP domain-containing histidine kinase [Oscillospiraceae bacterium]